MPTALRLTWPAPLLALLLFADGPAAAAADARHNARIYDRAAELVERRYFDPALKGLDWAAVAARHRDAAVRAQDERALYTAINAMLDVLGDSHVFATSPGQWRRMNADDAEDGDAGASGFGLDLLPADGGQWEVASLVPGGPAARAGVQIGWTLATVDGRPPDGIRSFGAGDRATLGFRDDAGRLRAIALVGEALPDEPERTAMLLPGGVLLLAFPGFDPGVDRWIAGEIATYRPAAVILDLRDNGGGESRALDRTAGLFFTARRPVLRLIRRRETVESTAGAGRDSFTGPLAVLVGPRSASAAEAFAAMVEESGRGPVVGQRTAGALTGAALYRLPDGGRLSVAEYDVRTPGGRRLEKVGLAPTHLVTPSLAERRRGEDPVLQCARLLVTGGRCPVRPPAG